MKWNKICDDLRRSKRGGFRYFNTKICHILPILFPTMISIVRRWKIYNNSKKWCHRSIAMQISWKVVSRQARVHVCDTCHVFLRLKCTKEWRIVDSRLFACKADRYVSGHSFHTVSRATTSPSDTCHTRWIRNYSIKREARVSSSNIRVSFSLESVSRSSSAL